MGTDTRIPYCDLSNEKEHTMVMYLEDGNVVVKFPQIGLVLEDLQKKNPSLSLESLNECIDELRASVKILWNESKRADEEP